MSIRFGLHFFWKDAGNDELCQLILDKPVRLMPNDHLKNIEPEIESQLPPRDQHSALEV